MVPTAMLAVSGFVGRVVVFAEAAALSLGIVGLRLPSWRRSPLTITLAPTAASAVGVALAQRAAARPALEVAGLAVALALLVVRRSGLTPTVSAAILPLVFGVRSWAFVAAVAVITGVLAAVATGRIRAPLPLRARLHRRAPARGRGRTRVGGPTPVGAGDADPGDGALPRRSLVVGGLVVAGWIALAGPVLGLPAPCLAPPLFVATFEWLARSERRVGLGVRQWAVVVVAAGIGAGTLDLVQPRWIAGVIALAIVASVLAVVRTPFPPALAVTLIPQVAVGVETGTFVLGVALGAGVLYGVASVAMALVGRLALRGQ